MESSSPSGKTSDPSSHRLNNFIGIIIAILTLTIPLLAVGYYSSPHEGQPLSGDSYSLRSLDR